MSQNERRPLKGAATDTAKDNPFIHLHRQRRAVAKPTADTHIPATGYEWMRWAREREIHPPAARHLLLLLSTYTDEHGVCWPGMVKLSKQMGLSPRRIRKLSEVLVVAGLLHVRHTPRKKNGQRGVNRYTLMPDRGMQATGGDLRPGVTEGNEPGDAGDRDRGMQATHEVPVEENPHLNGQPARVRAEEATDEAGGLSRSYASAGANGRTATSTSTSAEANPASERRGMQRAGGRDDPPVYESQMDYLRRMGYAK